MDLEPPLVGKELSTDILFSGLKTIGMHPIEQKHCFLELNLCDKRLDRIDLLTSYPNLMYLDISHNLITSLESLENMTSLIFLNASHNNISECLEFYPKHCNHDNAWSSGHHAVGSMLTIVDLSSNKIQAMRDMSRHRFLETLILNKNQISTIQGIHTLRFLKILDLSYNNIIRIQGISGLPIRDLILKGNKLRILEGLDELPHLTTLDISENEVYSLAPLTGCVNITSIDVSNNYINYIRQTEFLRDVSWLSSLCMSGNPCDQKPFYRLRVLYRLPHLTKFDSIETTTEEKVQAFNLYKSPAGDIPKRVEVLKKYLPTKTFIDYSPQLGYDEEQDLSFEDLAMGF
eukprot:gene12929-17330_t